jgi:cell division GTPase FtsZ
MSIEIGPPLVDELKPRITVIGVGGAGGNAIANMISRRSSKASISSSPIPTRRR